jgi:hypothetical protein
MNSDEAAGDIAQAQQLVQCAVDDIAGIEQDACNWGDGADTVENSARAARKALQELNKALDSALSNLDDDQEEA